MGIKMDEACYGGRVIKLNKYVDEMNGNIFCKYCGTPVTHVKAHIREVGECEVQVSAYFRLTNNKAHPHLAGCLYITENEIKDIYASCCDEDDLMTKEGEIYIVRLHILIDSLEGVIREKGGSNTEKKIKRSTLQYIKYGDKPAYITTLKRILKLRCKLDADGVGEIKEQLRLRFYNKVKQGYDKIPWNQFFYEYDKESYVRAFKYISKKIYHPVAFCGKVKSINLPNEGGNYYRIDIYSVRIEKGKYVSLHVSFTNPEIYEEIKTYSGNNVVVYCSEAYTKSSGKKKNKDGSEVEYYNIYTKIYGSNQIIRTDSF